MQGFQFPLCSLGLDPPMGGTAAPPGAAGGKGRARAGAGEVPLTHGSGLEVAGTVSREHTEPILGEPAWGTPAARLAAVGRAWQACTAKGQVLAGVRTGLPTGQEILAPATVWEGSERELVFRHYPKR